MKFRIFYKDQWVGEKSVVVEEDSFWQARTLGEKLFGDKFIRVEEITQVS